MTCIESMPYPKPLPLLDEAVRHKGGMHALEWLLLLITMLEIAKKDGKNVPINIWCVSSPVVKRGGYAYVSEADRAIRYQKYIINKWAQFDKYSLQSKKEISENIES